LLALHKGLLKTAIETGPKSGILFSAEEVTGKALGNVAAEAGQVIAKNPAEAAAAASKALAPKGIALYLEQVAQGVKAAGKYDATVGSLDEARQVIGKAMPDAVELPPAVAGQPYASPPPGVKKWFQVQPAEPNVGNMQPHIK
jgi:hypothetical protein